MHCPKCGTKLPELEWRKGGSPHEPEQYADTTCPNIDCEQVLVLTNLRTSPQDEKIEVTLY